MPAALERQPADTASHHPRKQVMPKPSYASLQIRPAPSAQQVSAR